MFVRVRYILYTSTFVLTCTSIFVLVLASSRIAHNPKSPDYVREKYEKKQKEFEENCRLPRLLGRSMTVNYKPPRELLLQRIQAFERCSSINDSADYWVQ